MARILRPQGISISYDIHPFQRPWENVIKELIMKRSYFDTTLPPSEDANGIKTYVHLWTISDIFNAIASAGMMVIEIEERKASNSNFWQGSSYKKVIDEELLDWHNNPRAGLPVWLTIASRKI